MNDRFKFRIFCQSENKMMLFNSPTLIDGDVQQGGLLFKNYDYKIKNCHELNPKDLKLMQCTGLKDKNKKLIFEGDIMLRQFGKPTMESINVVFWNKKQWQLGRPIFSECCKRIENYRTCSGVTSLRDFNNAEIIGNIYETPELLKGGQ